MVELKCRAELALTGRSACRNADCEHSKERNGRIPQGKLRWGIGGPGGHSMKWYCIRSKCLPYDQVKDMLAPGKCESAAEMEGVPELPPGFREATIAFLEAINEDRADQLDPAHLAKLDEVGPLLPVTPRAATSPRTETTGPSVGRQGLRRMKRSFRGGASSSADNNDSDEDRDSGDDDRMGMGYRGSGMAGSSSSSPSSLAPRTVSPPALLIPRRTDSGNGGNDSPVLPPPIKLPRLDEDIGGLVADSHLLGVGGIGGDLGVGGLGIAGGLGMGGLTGDLGIGGGFGGSALAGSGLTGGLTTSGGGFTGGLGVGGLGSTSGSGDAVVVASSSSFSLHPDSMTAGGDDGGGGGGGASSPSGGGGAESHHAFGGLSLYPSGSEVGAGSMGLGVAAPASGASIGHASPGGAGAGGLASYSTRVSSFGMGEAKPPPPPPPSSTFMFGAATGGRGGDDGGLQQPAMGGGSGSDIVESNFPSHAHGAAAGSAPTRASSLRFVGATSSVLPHGAGAFGAGIGDAPETSSSSSSPLSPSALRTHVPLPASSTTHGAGTASSAMIFRGSLPSTAQELGGASSAFSSAASREFLSSSTAGDALSSTAEGGASLATSADFEPLGGSGPSTDAITSSFLSSGGLPDAVASTLEGIGDDAMGAQPDTTPTASASTRFGQVTSSSEPVSIGAGPSTADQATDPTPNTLFPGSGVAAPAPTVPSSTGVPPSHNGSGGLGGAGLS